MTREEMWEELSGQIDEYALENVQTERQRIFGILKRIRESDDWDLMTVKDLEKFILGNKK